MPTKEKEKWALKSLGPASWKKAQNSHKFSESRSRPRVNQRLRSASQESQQMDGRRETARISAVVPLGEEVPCPKRRPGPQAEIAQQE